MKDFLLDTSGDVVLNQDIQMIHGGAQVAQKIRAVVGTNCGEWFLNPGEGIHFKVILTKNPDFDQIRDEIQAGLRQVDETYLITEFSHELRGRDLYIRFTAVNSAGEQIEEVVTFAH